MMHLALKKPGETFVFRYDNRNAMLAHTLKIAKQVGYWEAAKIANIVREGVPFSHHWPQFGVTIVLEYQSTLKQMVIKGR